MQETVPAAFNNRRSVDNRNGLKPYQSSILLAPHNSDIRDSITASRSMDNLSRLRTSQGSSPRMAHRGMNRNSGNYNDSDSAFSKGSADFTTSSYDSR